MKLHQDLARGLGQVPLAQGPATPRRDAGGCPGWDKTAREFERVLTDWAATADIQVKDGAYAKLQAEQAGLPAASSAVAKQQDLAAEPDDARRQKLQLMSRIVSLSEAHDWRGLKSLEGEALVMASHLRGLGFRVWGLGFGV
jgi:hypothetical protein